MKYIAALLCLYVAVCVYSCHKTADYIVPGKYTPVTGTLKAAGISTPLTGKWQWVQSFHSMSGLSNPALSQYTERLEFGTDSIMRIYRNDQYYYQFPYLYVKDYKYKTAIFDVAQVAGFTYKAVIKNDTLNLSTFDLADQNQLIYKRLQ